MKLLVILFSLPCLISSLDQEVYRNDKYLHSNEFGILKNMIDSAVKADKAMEEKIEFLEEKLYACEEKSSDTPMVQSKNAESNLM